MKTKFILFDFDGVIADSWSAAFATAKTIHPNVTEDDHKRRFERNIHESSKDTETYHDETCNHELDWYTIYFSKIKELGTPIFPGMMELILELEKDYNMIVISSSHSFPIEEFLVEHNLRSHFDWVMGNDVHKSKVEKIKMVFEKYGVGPQDCVFITDTLGDMHEAEKMQVPSIGVTWGFCTPETLQKGTYLKLVDTPENLKSAISEHFSS